LTTALSKDHIKLTKSISRQTIFYIPMQRYPFIIIILFWASFANATNVTMCTDLGRVVIELLDDDAPLHVTNFLDYTDRGFYGGTIFHRVIPGFVVQGGGFDKELRGKRPSTPVQNESRNRRKNQRGTLAAARTSDPHSASSQFFVNLNDNDDLNASRQELGYTVFGQVIQGMSVIDTIAKLPTGPSGIFPSDVPDPVISINSITRLEEERYSEVPHTERDGLIRAEIQAALNSNDQTAVFFWIQQMRNICGSIDSDLLVVESEAALAKRDEPAALASLEEYLRVTEDSHNSYARALELYLAIVPVPQENLATQAMMPSIQEIAGHCTPATVPAIPDGRSATIQRMISGQTELRHFMALTNNQLECLSELIDGEQLRKDEQALLTSYYNRRIEAMENSASNFNEQVQIVRARQ
jgi:cyclophilin family peptidyl-prolyl cis-trans isomerase